MVEKLKNQSGFSWSPERGADISIDSEGVWEKYIEVTKPLATITWKADLYIEGQPCIKEVS